MKPTAPTLLCVSVLAMALAACHRETPNVSASAPEAATAATEALEPVGFTADYIPAYDEEAAKAKNSSELIAAMKQRYPTLGALPSLELSAKVSKGEMKWP
jgi:hypothetical protein